MRTPKERYQTDAMFNHIVDHFYKLFVDAKMTPTEVREAAMLAQIMYEDRHPRPIMFSEDMDLIERYVKQIKPEHLFVPNGSNITTSNEASKTEPGQRGVRSVNLTPGIYAFAVLKDQIVVSKHDYIDRINLGKDWVEATYVSSNFYLEGTCPEDVVIVPV